jgi:hypothetical protein
MASNSETGAAVNIANYKLMIDGCVGFGLKYNPSNTDITIVNMTAQWTTCDTAHQTLTTAVQVSKNPINAREILFEPSATIVTRSLSYFTSTKASTQTKADAKGLADRFRGFNIKVVRLPDGTPDPAHVSTSHLSYVQKGDTFRQLVDLYNSEPLYAPNEADITTASLGTLSTAMKTTNDNLGTILGPVQTARIARDHALYDAGTGMVDVSLECKSYVEGVYKKNAPEAKLIRGIKLTRPKKKSS